ncbi:MAG: class I SAM-dependent methyltransferase [Infirmifilum sp.]
MLEDFEVEHVIKPFDRLSKSYDKGRLGWYNGMLRLLGDRAQEPLLDAGCGTGYIACLLARKGLQRIVCLDVSWNMLVSARNRARKWELEGALDFIQGSIVFLPFRQKAFETVLAAAVVHHVHGRRWRIKALRELKEVCRGFALITVWCLFDPNNLLRAVSMLSRDVLVGKNGKNKRYYHLYTPLELRRDLRSSGYESFKLYLWDYKRVLLKRNIVVEYYAREA